MVVKSQPNDVILWTLKGPSWGGWIGSLQPLDTEQVVSLSFTSTQHSLRSPCALRCCCWWSLSNIQQASSTLCSRKQLQKEVSHPWPTSFTEANSPCESWCLVSSSLSRTYRVEKQNQGLREQMVIHEMMQNKFQGRLTFKEKWPTL